jgi:hypothetical protein
VWAEAWRAPSWIRARSPQMWGVAALSVFSVASVFAGLVHVIQAADDGVTATTPEWWKVATGIIGVPAAVVALFYSMALVRKTRLESRKTELEIEEKQRALAEAEKSGDTQTVTRLLARPVLEGQLVQSMILRFILLFLFLEAWSIVNNLFNLIFTGTAAGISWASGSEPGPPIFILLSMIQAIPSVAYWLILLGIGWPLFQDASRMLGLTLPGFLGEREDTAAYRRVRIVVIAIVVASAVLGPLFSYRAFS